MSGPLLVFGATGQVGRALMDACRAQGVAAVGVARAATDIADPAAVARAVGEAEPRLVVNCAAHTAVDRAESEPELAAAVNDVGAGAVAEAAARAGVPVLHLSTDYVFNGTKGDAYTEDDPMAPLGVYGRTKAAGEARVRAATPRHVILRTSWVFGAHGHNFLKTMLRLAGERDELRVVADQCGCPTATPDIAAAVLAVDAALARGAGDYGTFHFAGEGATSWHGFAQAIVDAQAETTGRRPSVVAIATADYPTPARRPADSRLNSARFLLTFGLRAEPWPARVRETVRILLRQAGKEAHP